MATRRRKIARSAVRRVKRRASKSVKLRSLRYRKNSSKRMMTHRGGEGRDPGFEGLDKEKVFRTYCMIVEDDKSTFYYPIRSIFCILMYNHSSKHFHLFINEGGSQKKTIELIKGLCGIEIENPEILRWPLWCKYYYRFADDKLYSVQVASSSGPVNKSDITETEIKPASKSEVPALALRRARRRFVDFEWMRDGEVAGDVIEVYEQIELYPYLQPKPATFTSNKFDRVLYNFKLAINAKASCLAYDMPDYLEERKKESTKKIEEKWIETQKDDCNELQEKWAKSIRLNKDLDNKLEEEGFVEWCQGLGYGWSKGDKWKNIEFWKEHHGTEKMAELEEARRELPNIQKELKDSPCLPYFKWKWPGGVDNFLKRTSWDITDAFNDRVKKTQDWLDEPAPGPRDG